MRLLKYLLSFRWANTLSEIAGYLSALALVLATLAMMHGVLTRYVLGRPTVWQTEVSVYLLVFVTFVGAAYGLKNHAHVGVDLLVERLPVRRRLIMRLFTSTLSLAVVVAVIWTAYGTWWEALEGGFRSPTSLRAPLWVAYGILPLGMLLVAFQYIAFLIEGVQALRHGDPGAQGAALLDQGNTELAAAVQVPDADGVTIPNAGTTPAPGESTAHSEETERQGRS